MTQEHFKHVVTMTQTAPHTYKIKFRGIEYLPTNNPTALGVLLFGLRPFGVDYVDCSDNPSTFLALATHAATILHMYANQKPGTPADRRIDPVDLERWAADAVALAPTTEAAIEAKRLIVENLGPNAHKF